MSGQRSDDERASAETVAAAIEPGAASVSSAAEAGAVLAGRYEIVGFLGAGGMGSVYRARDRELGETVALKMLRRDLAFAPGMLERFRREVKLARRIAHRNVARVHDIGEHAGERFLTMEFVDGEPLSALAQRVRPMPLGRVLAIAADLCAGLASAHAAGVVHRDLKPDNVLIARDGRLAITDFGIARAVLEDGAQATQQTGAGFVGTPAYMAPEQVQGARDLDGRTDLYALGVLLFQLATGEAPWTGEGALAVAAARLLHPPPDPRTRRPELPQAFADVVLRLMARRREDRFASAEEVARALAAIDAAPEVRAPTPQPGAMPRPLTVETPAGHRTKTVAVLPFRNAGAPEDDYLAEEITDDLIDGLSMTPGLRVRARGAVARERGADRDPREVGAALGVEIVVEGSVRRAGDRVRVSARVVGVADGFQLWARRFERSAAEVLAIDDEVVRAVADALAVAPAAPARAAPTDAAAVELYLRGRNEYRKRWPDHQRRAIELFDEALALAPGDPMVLAARAMAEARLLLFTGESPSAAAAAAERAIAAAPAHGEPYLALALCRFLVGDVVGALAALRQALARNPNLAEAHGMVGMVLSELDAADEAERRLQAAVSLDAQLNTAVDTLVRTAMLRGDWPRVDALLAAHGRDEPLTSRMRGFIWRRDREAAAAFAAELAGETQEQLHLGHVFAEAVARGRATPEFEALVREAIANGSPRGRLFVRQLAAEVLAAVGEEERALATIAAAVDEGLLDVAWLDRCPLFDGLRADPRFAPLRATVRRRADEVLAAWRAPL